MQGKAKEEGRTKVLNNFPKPACDESSSASTWKSLA